MSEHIALRDIPADKLVACTGVASVIETLFFALCEPGEAVIIPTPYYAGVENAYRI